jgi:hypothetical protein
MAGTRPGGYPKPATTRRQVSGSASGPPTGFIGIVLGPLVAVLATAIVESYFARPMGVPSPPEQGSAGLD